MFCSAKIGNSSSNPGKVTFEVLVHLLRYIRGNNNLGLIYYYNIEYSTRSGILIQAGINTDNQFMVLSYYIWQDFPYNVSSKVSYIYIYISRWVNLSLHTCSSYS